MRKGPCSPWVSGQQVQEAPLVAQAATKASVQGQKLESLCALAAQAASHLLWELSGRVYTHLPPRILVRAFTSGWTPSRAVMSPPNAR